MDLKIKKRIYFTLSSFFLLLLLWQGATSLSPKLHFVLPSPLQIFSTLIELKTRFLLHTLATIKEIVGGFILASLASFPLAWIMLRFRQTRSFLQPLFIIIQSLPMFALAPIMVLWCGWGYTAVLLPTTLMIFFPLTLNIYQGLKATPSSLLDFFHIHGATESQIFFKLRLPWALPHIFSGLRIAAAIAGMGAVAGEWAGAQKGLGILMLESRRNFDLEITFGALVCLALLTTSLYGLILSGEYLLTQRPKITFSLSWNFWPPKRSFALPFLCATTLFLASSSCHRPEEPKKIRLMLDWLPNHNHIPLYAGINMGFFQEEGIELTLQKMQECGGVLSYLTSDQIDLAIHHLPGTLRAATKGAQLTLVGSLIPHPLHALIYHADATIEKPSDLSGKVLGYCIGGPDTSFLDFLLAKNQIIPREKKNTSVDLISAMGTGSVDFIYGGFWNVEPHLLESYQISTEYFRIDQLQIPTYDEMVIVAHKGSPYSQSPFVERFQRALQKSIAFCKQEPHKAFALYAAVNQDKREKTLLWEEIAWQRSYPLFADSQEIDLTKIELFHRWQFEEGIVGSLVDVRSLVPKQS